MTEDKEKIESDRLKKASKEIRRVFIEEANKFVAEPENREIILKRTEKRLKEELGE